MSESSGRAGPRARPLAIVNDSELTAIIEAIMDGVFIYAADGRLRMVNSTGKRLLAMDRQPNYATTPIDERVPLLAPLDEYGRPLPIENWPAQRVLRGEELRADHAAEIRVRAFDGRLVDLSVAGAPLRDAAGQVIGGVTIMRDVTTRRRMERRSQDALNALLELAEALVALPPTTRAVPGASVTSASAPGEDNDPPGDTDADADADATMTLRDVTPDGEAQGDALAPREWADDAQDASGEPMTRLAWLIRSVLGLRRVGVLLTEPVRRAITPHAIVGLAPAAERQWRERLVGATLSDLLPDAALRERLQADEPLALELHATARPIADALAPFGARQVVIAPMRIGPQMIGVLLLGADDDVENGIDTTVGSHGSHGNDRLGADAFPHEELALAGAVARMAALVIERERLIHERAEERARRIALSSANERMDEFLAVASHELKSPLTAIKANVQLATRRMQRLQRLPRATPATVDGGSPAVSTPTTPTGASAPLAPPAPPAPPAVGASAPPAIPTSEAQDDPYAPTIELLQRTEQQITRLNRLVDDLLDTSRIQAGKLELRPAPCDLTQLARDVVEEQRQSQPTRTITLAAPELPVTIRADADRVRQVIINYVTNAVKYSPVDRPVAVKISIARRRARLTVRDQGPGLPPDEQARIWERFHRAPGVEQQSGAGVGLGLGLYISRTLIERLGGHVGVESAVGQGSTFWFTLPLTRQ